MGVFNIAEMWHGPTGAFKDIALSVVGRLVDHFLKKQVKKAHVIVSTSGDTGSAAIHSVLGSKNVNIIVWYPRKRVSRVQELQMTTVDAPNVKVFSADGTSDDIDVPMKSIFADPDFVAKYNLVCFNSVNVARVILQAAHFIYIYLKVCPGVDHEVTFCVPSGGLGNIASGVIAHTMGLPIKFVSAVNENDIVDRAFRCNDFSLADTVKHTPSSAMDIQMPYNIERAFYYLSGQNSDILREVMETFERDGCCKLPPVVMENNTFLETTRVDTSDMFATMKKVWRENSYLLCPHTAVAMHGALNLVEKQNKSFDPLSDNNQPTPQDIVVIATATPAKFPEVISSVGLSVPLLESIDRLSSLPEKKEMVERDENWEQRMREAVMNFGK